MTSAYQVYEETLPEIVPLEQLPELFKKTYPTVIGYLNRWKIERVPDEVDGRVKCVKRADVIMLLRKYRVYG